MPSIILAGGGPLVKMRITLEPHSIFSSKFACLYILTLSRHWSAKWRQGYVEHQSGWSWSISENAHNS